jgi:hypothetical protein
MPSGGHNNLYSEELAREICEIVATTPAGLDEICERYPHLPESRTIYRWLFAHEDFDVRYTRAKIKQCDAKLEAAYKILKDAEKVKIVDEKGRERIDNAAITSAKNTVDLIKWEIARLSRKKYGDIAIDENEKVNQPINIYYDKPK